MPDFVVGLLTWTPPSEIVFGEFSGTPNRYKFVVTGKPNFYILQNEAGTLDRCEILLERGKEYHIECIPQYAGDNIIVGTIRYFDGKAIAIDITVP